MGRYDASAADRFEAFNQALSLNDTIDAASQALQWLRKMLTPYTRCFVPKDRDRAWGIQGLGTYTIEIESRQ